MLESLEQSNIKRMSLESPEAKASYFDPEKEMTDAWWNEIIQDVNSDKWIDSKYVDSLIGLKIAFPERFAGLAIKQDRIKKFIDQLRERELVVAASQIAIIDPAGLSAGLRREIGADGRKKAEKFIEQKDFYSLSPIVEMMNELGEPLKLEKSIETQLLEKEKNDVDQAAAKYRASLEEHKDASLFSLLFDLKQARMMFPEVKFIKFSQEDINNMIISLHNHTPKGKDTHKYNFLSTAEHMQIAQADRIVFDGQGMHLFFEPDLGSETPALPEQRNF